MKASEAAARLLRFLNALDATPWEESEHPRKKDGKFAPKGGGEGTGGGGESSGAAGGTGPGPAASAGKPAGPSAEFLRQANKALETCFGIVRTPEAFSKLLTGVLQKVPEGTAADIQSPDLFSDETYTAVKTGEGWHLTSGGKDVGVVEASAIARFFEGAELGPKSVGLMSFYNPEHHSGGHSEVGTDKRATQVRETVDLAKRSIQFRVQQAARSPEGLARYISESTSAPASAPDPYDEILAAMPPQSDVTRGLNYGDKFTASLPRSSLPEKVDHYTMLAILAGNNGLPVKKEDVMYALRDEAYCAKLFAGYINRLEAIAEEETRSAERDYDRASLYVLQGRLDADTKKAEQSDQRMADAFGADTSPAASYLRQMTQAVNGLDFRSYAVQQAYVCGGMGTSAETINRKMYTRQELSPAEQEYVDTLRGTAVAVDEDMVLYRMAGKDFIQTLFGAQAAENPASAANAEAEMLSFSSCTAGAYEDTWSHYPCVMRIRLRKGQKAIIPDNAAEGEVILLNGARVRVTAARVLENGERLPVHYSATHREAEDCGGKLLYDVEVLADGSDA